MKTNRFTLLVVCLSVPLLLSGCWNSRELSDLAIVSGIGVDKVPDSDELRITFQVVNPSATASSVGASTGQSTISIFSATDHTIFGALRKASKSATRQLFFAHTQLLVIGESLARSGINDIFDIFERSHELRLNTAVLVSRDTDAASILKVLLPQESVASIGMVKKTQNTSNVWGENRKVTIYDLINGITGESDLTISGVRRLGNTEEGSKKTNLEQSEPQTSIQMSGLGVIKKGKLEKWLSGPEARGTQFILNKIDETIINIDAGDKEKSMAVNVYYSDTHVRVEVKDGVPVFHINISEEGIINETRSFVDLSSNKEIRKLEDELEKQTKAEVQQAVQVAQSMGADIFNFGNDLKRTHPAAWKTVENEWDRYFAIGKLEVHVDAYIRSTGMRLKPYLSPKD